MSRSDVRVAPGRRLVATAGAAILGAGLLALAGTAPAAASVITGVGASIFPGASTGTIGPVGATPAPVVARLESELRRILALTDIQSAFGKPGMNVHFAPAREFAAFLDAEIERWGVAVKVSGAQVD